MAVSPQTLPSVYWVPPNPKCQISADKNRRFLETVRQHKIALAIEEKRTFFHANAQVSDGNYGFLLKRTTELIRSTNRAKRKALYNVYKKNHIFRSFLTLTFHDPEPIPSVARSIFSNFMRKLRKLPRYKSSRLGYFARMECGAKKGRLHFHILFDRPVNSFKLVSIWIQTGGGKINKYECLQTNEKCISYLMKYTSKTNKGGNNNYALFNNALKGKRFFWSQKFDSVPSHISTQFLKKNCENGKEIIVGIETSAKHEIPLKYSTVLIASVSMQFERLKKELDWSLGKNDPLYLPPTPFFNEREKLIEKEKENARAFSIYHRTFQRLSLIIQRNDDKQKRFELNLLEELSEYDAPLWVFEKFDKSNLSEKIKLVYQKLWLKKFKKKS